MSVVGVSVTNTLFTTAGRPEAWQLGFQTPAASLAEGIIAFHDDLMVFLTLVFFFVVYLVIKCIQYFSTDVKKGETERLVHASTLEIIWTLIPAMILVIIAIPSFSLLYSVDEIVDPLMTIKVIGHQWYWSYEFINGEALSELIRKEMGYDVSFSTAGFDSYMLSDEDVAAQENGIRLLSVDHYLHLPTETNIRALITSADVLHAWTVPSLGVKVDACPGRLNQAALFIKYKGTFYGQCSEICGVNHGFMPIGIKAFDFNLPKEMLEHYARVLEPVVTVLQGLAAEE